MSSGLAIAAVTAALKDRLNDGLLNHDLSPVGSFSVTAQPPERISAGSQETNLLNLFLYQVTPNLGWRNADLPSRDNGGARVSNPPLALDLHYLLTAYGAVDLNAEILLGYGMQLLHQFPGLSREQLRKSLGDPSPLDGTIHPGPFGTMSAVDLADQVELIKIAPQYLSADDLSKLWTAMQARYRPSMAYLVSVVLIQGTGPANSPPPVLKRGPNDQGPVSTAAPFPALASVRPAASDALPAMRLGDDLIITGSNVGSQAGTTAIFENGNAALVQELTTTTSKIPGTLAVHVPSVAERASAINEWAVGIYTLSLRINTPNLPAWVTNSVPIALAPVIALDAAAVKPNQVAVGVEVSLSCTPRLTVLQEKNVRVIFGAKEIVAKAVVTPIDDAAHPNNHDLPTSLSFLVPATDSSGISLKPGEYLIRLRVDGIDSIPITLTGSPPRLDFDPQQKVNVA